MSGRGNYLTLTDFHVLRSAVEPIAQVWDTTPYLVGSVLERPDFRDVDVRLILSDKMIRKFFRRRPVLMLANLTASAYLERITGLPIDFQYQPRTEASEYDTSPRHPLMTVIGITPGALIRGEAL